MTIYPDTDPDWLRRIAWEFPTDPQEFVQEALGGDLSQLDAFLALDVAQAMPEALRASLAGMRAE